MIGGLPIGWSGVNMKADRPTQKTVTHNERRQIFVGLGLILLVAFLLRIYFALAFPNVHHPDEVFQYLEQAHRLVFKYGVIPWEYREATRSWIVPGFLGGILKLTDTLNLAQPPIYFFLVIASLSAFSLSAVLIGFFWGYRTQGLFAGTITAALCCLWFELIYFAPKTLVEPIAANILLIGVYLAYPGQPIANKHRLFAAGLFFGLVVAIRVNLAPAVLVAAAYICRRQVSEKSLPIILGGVVAFLLAGMLDAFTWRYPFQSFVSNIWINVIEKKSHNYGTEPWYYYAKNWALVWGGAIVPMALLAAIALRKNLLLGLIAATIVATHMLFAHKEYRFVFPAVPFIVILIGLGTAEVFGYVQNVLSRKNQQLTAGAVIIFGWAITSAILGAGDRFRPNWLRGAGSIHAFDYLRDRSDLCGVGLVDYSWDETAGYAHLHRNVPIIIPSTNIAASFPAYNYVLANSPKKLPSAWLYSKVWCWRNDEICVYHRAGLCAAAPTLEINEVIRLRGQ